MIIEWKRYVCIKNFCLLSWRKNSNVRKLYIWMTKLQLKKGLPFDFYLGHFTFLKSQMQDSVAHFFSFFSINTCSQLLSAGMTCRHDLQTWPAAIICIHDQQPWPAVMIVCEYCHCVGNCTNFLSTYTCRKIWLISCFPGSAATAAGHGYRSLWLLSLVSLMRKDHKTTFLMKISV